MQSKHLKEKEIQNIAEGKQISKIQHEHLTHCRKCSDDLNLYKLITVSLNTSPEYDTTHLTSKSVIKKLNAKRLFYLISPKFDVYLIVFLFITAVVVSFLFTDFIPSLHSIDLSAILKVFTDNEFLSTALNTLSLYSQILVYIPIVLLILFVTLFFEKILSTVKHRTNHT